MQLLHFYIKHYRYQSINNQYLWGDLILPKIFEQKNIYVMIDFNNVLEQLYSPKVEEKMYFKKSKNSNVWHLLVALPLGTVALLHKFKINSDLLYKTTFIR